jgi:hypothetical protein
MLFQTCAKSWHLLIGYWRSKLFDSSTICCTAIGIRQVIEQCAIEGVAIHLIEAAKLLKSQLPKDSVLLDRIIEGEIVEVPRALLAA